MGRNIRFQLRFKMKLNGEVEVCCFRSQEQQKIRLLHQIVQKVREAKTK